MLKVEIKADDLKELEGWAQEIQERLSFATQAQQEKLKKRLQKVMSDDLQKRFASSPSTTQGGYVEGGEYWKPLSESYLAANPSRAQGRIYIDTGELMRSFQVGSPNLVSQFTDSLTYDFGTRIPYAKELQNLRQIVFFYDKLLDDLALEFLEWAIELPDDSQLEQEEGFING